MNWPVHDAGVDYEALGRRRAAEFEKHQRASGEANVRENLIRSVREGLRTSWSASPDLYPRSFSLDATAAVCAEYILSH